MDSHDEMFKEEQQAMKDGGHPTEKEMCEAKVPTFDTVEELAGYVTTLVDRPHDYGTCVYAMSHAAVAAFNLVARKLGVTGFQASCADMDILRRTRMMDYGFTLVSYDQVLYPQYWEGEWDWKGLMFRQMLRDPDNASYFAKKAREKLAEERGPMSGRVREHWEWLASLAPKEDGDG